MTEFRDTKGNNVYVKDFGTDKLPVGTVLISNRTNDYVQLKKVAGNVVPVSMPRYSMSTANYHRSYAKLH